MAGINRLFVILFGLSVLSYATISHGADSKAVTERLTEIQQLTDTEQALLAIDSLLTNAGLSASERAKTLTVQAKLYFQRREFRQALETADLVVELAKEHHWQDVAAKALKMKGIFQYYQGNYPQALAGYQQALERYQLLQYQLEQAHLHNNIGLVHAAMGDTLQALESYQLAEAIYQQIGTDTDLVDIRYNIAGLYLRLRRYDIATEMFEQVLNKRLEFKDQAGVANTRSDIGVTHKQSGNYDAALENLQLALAYYQQQQDNYHLASTYHNLAEVYNEIAQAQSAENYARLAVSLSEQYNFNAILAGSLQSLARALFLQGETTQPLALLQRSTAIAQQSDYQQQLRANLSLLSLVQVANGDRVQALKSYQAFRALNYQLSNDQLNEYLAKFESSELKQQLAQLQQSEKLKQLETERASQQQKIVFGVIFIALTIIFFINRRRVDRQLKAELAIQVKQRTQELEELTEELQQANSVKSQFLANMSHEIRTPLTAIIGQAEAIISGDIDPSHMDREVSIIHANSLHLLELINNILDLSKIEANKLELELQRQDLQQMLKELANMFTEQARRKGLKFSITHSLSCPFLLKIDGLRVKQILINLCSNAIKFTEQGQVTLNVTIVDNELVFSVTDTGIGLSYTQILQVFESFTQGDSSISRRFGGTGLGLCLSDQLAKLMNGRIEINSQLGQGSTFSFILPYELGQELTKVDKVMTIDAKPSSAKAQHFAGTVLLAEDHDDNRRLFARFLKSLGLKVVGAANGQEAIEQYLEHQPDLILMDIQMPEMDGIEAFQILKQKGCSVPIIALTANAMSHEVAHYITLGFSEHLKKPIERAQFVDTLAKYFSNTVSPEVVSSTLDEIDMSDLVQQFKSTLTLEQQDIVAHLKASNYSLLQELVHRIAGAAQMFGFALLSEKALALEYVIKEQRFAEINDATQLLLNEIDQVLW